MDSLECYSVHDTVVKAQGEEWARSTAYQDFQICQLDSPRLKVFIRVVCKEALVAAGYDLPESLKVSSEDLGHWKSIMSSYDLEIDQSCINKESFFSIHRKLFQDGTTPGRLCAFIFGCRAMVLAAAPLGKVDELMEWIDEFIDVHLTVPCGYSKLTLLSIAVISVCIGAYMNY